MKFPCSSSSESYWMWDGQVCFLSPPVKLFFFFLIDSFMFILLLWHLNYTKFQAFLVVLLLLRCSLDSSSILCMHISDLLLGPITALILIVGKIGLLGWFWGNSPMRIVFAAHTIFKYLLFWIFWISFYYKFVDRLYTLNLILEDDSYVRFLIIFGQIFIHPWKPLSSLLCLPYLVGWVQVFCVLRAKYVFNLLLDFCFWGLQT